MMQEEQNKQPEQAVDTTDYRQIRLDKLEALKAQGENPFELTSFPVSVQNA